MAKTTKARSRDRNHTSANKPADSGIHRAAKRAGIDVDEARAADRARTHARLVGALKGICGQGLYIDDNDAEQALTYERAIMHVAVAQLRAIKMATFAEEEPDMGSKGWSDDGEEFTSTDAAMALSGVIALLKHSPLLIETIREFERATTAAGAARFERFHNTEGGAS